MSKSLPLLDFWAKRARSFVWQYFGFRGDGHGNYLNHNQAICRICDGSVKYIGNTTNLAHHLNHYHSDTVVLPTTTSTNNSTSKLNEEPKPKRHRNDLNLVEFWGRPKRSQVWLYFGFYATADGTYVNKNEAICRICHCKLRYYSNTTNLANHLDRHHSLKVLNTESVSDSSAVVPTHSSTSYMNLVTEITPIEPENEDADLKIAESILANDNPEQLHSLSLMLPPNVPAAASPSAQTQDMIQGSNRQDPVHGFPGTDSGRRRSSNCVGQLTIGSDRLAAITRALADFLVRDCHMPCHIGGTGFGHLMQVLEPCYRLPSVEYFRKVLQQLSEETHSSLEERGLLTPNRHVLTIHEWSVCEQRLHAQLSSDGKAFKTLVAHYLTEDFKLECNVLETLPASAQEQDVSEVITRWQLKMPLIVKSPGDETNQSDNETLVVPCMEASISKAIKECVYIPAIRTVILECIDKITKIQGYIDILDELTIRDMKDLSDGCHWRHWNSLITVLDFYMDQLPQRLEELPEPTKKTMEIVYVAEVQDLCSVLKPLQTAMEMITSQDSDSASLILPTLFKLLHRHLHAASSDSSLVSAAKTSLRETFLTIYNKPQLQTVLRITTAIDPRLKSLDWMSQDEQEEVFLFLEEEAVRTFNTKTPPAVKFKTEPGTETTDLVPTIPKRDTDMLGFLADVLSPAKALTDISTPQEKVKTEIDRYRSDQNATSIVCPLSWWASHTASYPLLSQVARNLLCLPATCRPPVSMRHPVVDPSENFTSEDVNLITFLHNNLL